MSSATKHPDIFTPEEAAEYLSSPTGGRNRALAGAVVSKRAQTVGAEFRSEGALTMQAMFYRPTPTTDTPEMARLRRENDRLRTKLEEAGQVIADLGKVKQQYQHVCDVHRETYHKVSRVRKANQRINRRLANAQLVCDVPPAISAMSGRVCQFACKLISPPCVYFLLEQGEVVYVGQTTNLLQRIADHYAGGEGKTFDEVYYLPVRQAELSRVERAFIAKLSPPLNESRPFVEPADADRVCKKFEVTA